MILSFHPCFVGDKNLLCAGREPDTTDLALIRQADAVILPQGCGKSLYEMARKNCTHVFPNYDARFAFPGKIGQIKLFNKFNAPVPKTNTFQSLKEYFQNSPSSIKILEFNYPFVFKFDWGGESDNVLLITAQKQLDDAIQRTVKFETTGQNGFLIQEFISCSNRSLRVVVIGEKLMSYWRVQPDHGQFSTGISKGAVVDLKSDPALQRAGVDMVGGFCRQTGINLAGFDLIVNEALPKPSPLFLEINYFFGRTGLGGSDKFYKILNNQINRWLTQIGLPA